MEFMEFSAAWIAVIIIVLAHVVHTVWWASRMNTLLGVLQRDYALLMEQLHAIKNTYMSKEDAAREFAFIEKQHNAIWKKLDGLHAHKKSVEE